MDLMVEITLTRGRALVLALVVLAVLVVAGRRLAGAEAGSRPSPAGRLQPVASRPALAARVVVHVVGAVRRPGLYRLPRGSRIADALARAGGATRKAQLELVNVAAPLADGEQVVVPRRGAVAAASAPTGAAGPAATGPVHLSTATADELDSLPGVGPVTAEKIIAYRQQHGGFSSVDELDAVPGIGPARMEQLKGLVAP
jgi:competence protein ComEA